MAEDPTAFLFKSENLQTAERLFNQGQDAQAAYQVKPIIDRPFSPTQSPDYQRTHVGSTVLYVKAQTNLANLSWTAASVAEHLQEARRGIQLYQDPSAINVLKEHESDVSTSVADYLLTLAALTGNTGYLDQAIDLLDRSVKEIEGQSTDKTAIIFERERILWQREHDNHGKLKMAADDAIGAATEAGRWDSVATIAAKFSFESVGREWRKTMESIERAQEEDPGTQNIYKREEHLKNFRGMRRLIWRLTALTRTENGRNYSNLALPGFKTPRELAAHKILQKHAAELLRAQKEGYVQDF